MNCPIQDRVGRETPSLDHHLDSESPHIQEMVNRAIANLHRSRTTEAHQLVGAEYLFPPTGCRSNKLPGLQRSFVWINLKHTAHFLLPLEQRLKTATCNRSNLFREAREEEEGEEEREALKIYQRH